MSFGALIWGAAFVFQSMGMDYIGPLLFGAVRFLMGALAIIPLILMRRHNRKLFPDDYANSDNNTKKCLLGGAVCGVALFAASAVQQIGLQYTTASKAGFLTALYMILVPIFAFVFLRKKVSAIVWLAVAIASVGTYFLCINGDFYISSGDTLIIIGSALWAVQILCIDSFSRGLDGLEFAFYEFMTCSALSFIFAFCLEEVSLEGIVSALVPLLYCGVLSVGVGFSAQVICQKHMDPSVASLLMSTESVFAAIFGVIILHETLTPREIFGCALVFAAVLVTLIPTPSRGAKRQID